MNDKVLHAKIIGLKGEIENINVALGPMSHSLDRTEACNIVARYNAIRTAILARYSDIFDNVDLEEVPEPGVYNTVNHVEHSDRDVLSAMHIKLRLVLDTLRALTDSNMVVATITKKGAFFSGQPFDAMSAFTGIVQDANKSIWIVDNFPNKMILDVCGGKKQGVEVKLLCDFTKPTQKKKEPAFQALARTFNAQHGSLEAKNTSDFHDRFVIVDENEVYHFGASIEHMGDRGFMYSRIEEREIQKAVRAAWDHAWKTGIAIPL